jgi:effector-binding domain-containing protein
MSQPAQIVLRAAQPYAGIRVRVTMDGLSGAMDEAFPELFGWLAAQDVPAAGPPFIRYLVVDMAAELQIELAVPVSADISGAERIQPGVLPAGRYVTLRHTGPYDGLSASNAALQQWARRQGITFDTWDTPGGHGVARPRRALPHQPRGRARPREVGSGRRLPRPRGLSPDAADGSSLRAPAVPCGIAGPGPPPWR